MQRVSYMLLLIVLALPLLVLAQDPTEEPDLSLPAMIVTPEVTGEDVGAVPVVDEALPLLISARSDVELLASDRLGANRPLGWSGVLDINDPQMPILLRLDLELLASEFLGVESRPEGWFGAVRSSSYAIARDIRHDLELLADTAMQPNVRPSGWSGSDPMLRCNRATQSLVLLLERGGYILQADLNSPDFCRLAEIEVSQVVEANGTGMTAQAAPVAPSSLAAGAQIGASNVAVFGDRNARQRYGAIPAGTPFQPVARSTAQFSNMMVIRGEGFEVFVDYTYTTVTSEQFEALPDFNTSPVSIQCTAAWCVG